MFKCLCVSTNMSSTYSQWIKYAYIEAIYVILRLSRAVMTLYLAWTRFTFCFIYICIYLYCCFEPS